jgi:hypothetical protein
MQTEAHFTLQSVQREIPFAIVTERSGSAILYSIFNGVEYKFTLLNENGIFRLVDQNPFEESDEIVNEKLIELSSDYLEKQSQGFDSTAETSWGNRRPGYGPDDIFVENKPFSLKQIIDLIEDGDIELSPDFQRNFVWDKTRQSRLIESILLGLPLPSIYLSQYEDGRLTVVDGLQRLSTIKMFMDDILKLTNLEYLQDCNEKRFSQLESVLSPLRLRRFGQTQVMCYVIDYRSPSQLKFDLFRRLNTGGKPLNNQEIRNCLSRPSIQQLLKTMIGQQSFKEATDNSVKDTRMDAREAALRFIYFYEQHTDENPVGQYNGDMETTLDDFVDMLNKRTDQEVQKYISIYDNALKNAYHLFGDQCFRKVIPESLGGRRSQVNKLMMLTLSVLLSKYQNSEIADMEFESLIQPIATLISDEEGLFETLTYSTNSKANIETSFRSFKAFLEENIASL